MGLAIAGVIEGFYGRPWSWDERLEVMRAGKSWGLGDYVYAPKDDPKHRQRWRDPYDRDELNGFARLVESATLRVGFALSPGLSIDYDSADDRAALAAKVDQVLDFGVGLVCLALDDIPFRPGLGRAHASLTVWLREHLADRAALVLVPTEYVGTRSTSYLDALAAGVPADVPIAWTGDTVVADAISADSAMERAAALGGRPPLVWDNYPVNDGLMDDRLFLGPLWGREPRLRDVCSGWLANPMVQPRSSLLPLASIAAWLRGDDELDAWAREAEARGWRVFAEACDGAVPGALVSRFVEWIDDASSPTHATPLREWLEAAESCTAPGLEAEAASWLDQVHAEAALGLAALQLIDHTRADPVDAGQIVHHAFLVAVTWRKVRRSPVTVMGPRCSIRPVLGAREDGTWSFDRRSISEDQNATDALVRAALAAAAAATAD